MISPLAMIVAAAFFVLNPGQNERPVKVSMLSLLRPEKVNVSNSMGAEVSVMGVEGETKRFILGKIEKIEITSVTDSLRVTIKSTSEQEHILPAASSMRISAIQPDSEFLVEVLSPVTFRRRIRGELLISAENGILRLALFTSLERLVAEAAAAELGDDQTIGADAFAAQAVAIRSYLSASGARHGGEGFDFCDTTHCLLFRGLDGAFGNLGPGSIAKGREAAMMTRGIVLSSGGRIVPGYFHAACGGKTASAAMIWQGSLTESAPSGVECEFCSGYPQRQWRRLINMAVLVETLTGTEAGGEGGGGPANRPWRLRVDYYPGSPYVKTVRLEDGTDKKHEFSADEFRVLVGRKHGWDLVRSNAFEVETDGEEVIISGAGHGHGVGLCQAGAIEAARRGWHWRRILRHYYPEYSLRQFGGRN